MKRFKNYVLWTAVASLLGMVLLDFELVQDLSRYDKYVEAVLSILIILGIINNPSKGKGLKDK